MKNSLNKLFVLLALFLCTGLLTNTVNAQAGVTDVSIDGCCVTFTIQFNETGGDWVLYPDYPNLTPVYSGTDPSDPITVEHCFEENGTYQYWFNQEPFNGNSGFYEVTDCLKCDDPTDCSGTDCNCELVVTVTDVGQNPYEGVAVGGNVTGGCDIITADGSYCYIMDANNAGNPVTYGVALSGNATNVEVAVTVQGCGVDLSFNLGSGHPVFMFFEVNEECPEQCVIVEENCEYVEFEYCCDGTLTSTFSGPVQYVKWHNATTWQNGWICGPGWNGEPACTGTILTTLDPNESWALEIGSAGGLEECAEEWPIYIDIDCGKGEERSDLMDSNVALDEISIYPNPAKDYINVLNIASADQQVQIMNSNGQQLIVERLEEGNSKVDISGITPGFYFVRIIDLDSGKHVHSEKIVVIK